MVGRRKKEKKIRYWLVGGRRNGRQLSFLILKYGFDSSCWGEETLVVELEKRFCFVLENLLEADKHPERSFRYFRFSQFVIRPHFLLVISGDRSVATLVTEPRPS